MAQIGSCSAFLFSVLFVSAPGETTWNTAQADLAPALHVNIRTAKFIYSAALECKKSQQRLEQRLKALEDSRV